MSERAPSVFVIGEAMIELSGIERDRARLGVAGDTFNTAVYLSRLGCQVSYVTALGDDPFSDRIREACRLEGVATDYVSTVPGGTPGLYAVSVDADGERSFTYWRSQSAARQFFETRGWERAFEAALAADCLYLSGITLSLFDGKADRDRLFALMDRSRSTGKCVAFDPNYRPRGWQSADEAQLTIGRAISLSSLTLPTFDDEQLLFGDDTPQACAARHLAIGARDVLVKDGPRGAFHPKKGLVPPPRQVRPVDTTGAGDSFNAGFLASYLLGADTPAAIEGGHLLAAKVLKVPGAILPVFEDLERPGSNL